MDNVNLRKSEVCMACNVPAVPEPAQPGTVVLYVAIVQTLSKKIAKVYGKYVPIAGVRGVPGIAVSENRCHHRRIGRI